MGILRQTKVPQELVWMTDTEIQLLLAIYVAGDTGLHKTSIAKLVKLAPDSVFNLSVRDLVEWLTDKSGREVSLVPTWKGEEIAKILHQIARNGSIKPAYTSAPSH